MTDSEIYSESTSIPVNPRTNRPVGYAFVDLKSADEATKAIENLSGKDILDRKVSVQLARKPEDTKEEGADKPKRPSGRGRGGRTRGRGGRGGAAARDSKTVSLLIRLTKPYTDRTRTFLLQMPLMSLFP